jgi:hypothetical protein
MNEKIHFFLNHYGLLAASISIFLLAAVLLFRSREIGFVSVVFSLVLIMLGLLLLFFYLSNLRKRGAR